MPEWRSAQADRSKFFLDSRLWPLDCLYFHLPPAIRNCRRPLEISTIYS
jgi:hypothetical protein